MVAVSGSLTGTANSAEFTPSNGVTDVIIDSAGCRGKIFLLVKATNTEWKVVTEQHGAFSILTPDTALVYRFSSQALNGTAEYYIGP